MPLRSLFIKAFLLACFSPPSTLINAQQATQPPKAVPKPSFDCAKAKTPYETDVCNNVELAKLDVAIAKAYADAQVRLKADAAALAVIKASQRELIAVDVVFHLVMERQLKFLEAVDGKPRTSLEGYWVRPGGTALFKIGDNGKLDVGVSTIDGTPPNFQICEWDGSAVPKGRNAVRSKAEDGWGLDFARDGRILKIKAIQINKAEANRSRRHCTFGSAPEGTFIAASKGVDD